MTLTLPPETFRHWDVVEGAWRLEGGPAEFLVGESSRTIRLRGRADLSSLTLPGLA